MKKNNFSLIEIAISLAVAFLAITVLIAFFPTSFKRMRNAQNSSYVTHTAQEFTTYLKNSLTVYPIPDKMVESVSGTSPNLTITYKSITGDDNDYAEYLQKWEDNINVTSTTNNPLPLEKVETLVDWSSVAAITGEGTTINRHDSEFSVFLIRSTTDLANTSTTYQVDHAIEARIWKSPYVKASQLSPTKTVSTSGNESLYYDDDYSNAARVNIEFSWPVTVAYADRTKKSYHFMDLIK